MKLKNLFPLLLLIGVMGAKEPRFGRISVLQGDATITKAGEIDWDYCTINMIVEEGDLIRTDEDSRLEIQLDNGIILRMDEETEIVFSELERDRSLGKEVTVIDLGQGNLRINIPKSKRYDLYVVVETPTSSVVGDEKTDFRVNVRRSSSTEVFVFKGRVQLRTEDETVHLRKREWAKVDPYGELDWVRDFDRKYFDDFDLWCDRYDEIYREVVRVEYIPSEIVIGYVDLSLYGSWRYITPYGWVWIPVVEPGWRPYTYGRWVWTISFGWVWVPYEPWGWIPFHYGRWAYVVGYGWVWIPGAVWGPGWVAWAYGPGWIAWAPLDPWDDPIIFIGVGVSFSYGWTCVTYQSFIHPRYKYKPPRHGRYKDPGYTPYKPPRLGKKHFKNSPPPSLTKLENELLTLKDVSVKDETSKLSTGKSLPSYTLKTPSPKKNSWKSKEIKRNYDETFKVERESVEKKKSFKSGDYRKKAKESRKSKSILKEMEEITHSSKKSTRKSRSGESFFKSLIRDIGDGISKIGKGTKITKSIQRKSKKFSKGKKGLDGKTRRRDN
jgi:hypothetical protein